jgi:ABC-type transport system involved in multi-copper enzyme maturation permease subunit
LYSGLGLLWLVLWLQFRNGGAGGAGGIAVMNTFQVAVGLLLLSVSAATNLVEERVRGSLCVLLATPLSTGSILAGKWLGSFRNVVHVLVWPAITAGILVVQSGRVLSYLLLLGLILAYGAALTSLGLALGSWVSRPGRAVALCVAAYVLFSIGWLVLVASVTSRDPVGVTMIMGSPLYGTPSATMAVSSEARFPRVDDSAVVAAGSFLWILIHSALAALLFAVTLATFDGCLGRVSDTPGRPIPSPGKKPWATRESADDDWLADDPADVSEPASQ